MHVGKIDTCLESLLPRLLRQRETHLVCLSCSDESAIKALSLSLALYSIPRVFHVALTRSRRRRFAFVSPSGGVQIYVALHRAVRRPMGV